ncbi:MAG: protease SohB, partial [Gammaproteobacteria bacterium]|nr:protease SohB [Gammaproteobacteria bacterium]
IETTKVNDEIDAMRFALDAGVSDPDTYKLHIKQKRQEIKLEHKARKKALKQGAKGATTGETGANAKPRVFVLDFVGDLRALAVARLRREITAVLSMAQASDEVVVRLESRGGMVHAYGLASSQLDRIKEHGVSLTVCVDKVAASGGYMMACVANKILAAPFAILGSIGVLAQIPNFNRLLKKHDIDFEMITAGEFKRTLTILGENTDKGREKFTEEIEDIHLLFKQFVTHHRPGLDIERVATGESWFGQRALDRALVDELITSDEYIAKACEDSDVFEVKYVEKKPLPERLGIVLQDTVDGLLMRWWERGMHSRFFS